MELTSKEKSSEKILDELDESQILLLNRHLKPGNIKNIFLVLLASGARTSEILQAKFQDLETSPSSSSQGFIYLNILGKKKRKVLLPLSVFSLLQRREKSDFLFTTKSGKKVSRQFAYSSFANSTLRILGRKATLKTIRQTFFARKVRENPTKIQEIAEYTGNLSALSKSQLYLDILNPEELTKKQLLTI